MPVPFTRRSRGRFGLAPALSAVALVLGCSDTATTPEDPSGAPISAATTTTLVWRQVSAGADHTCGVTTADIAYCWGEGGLGELGTGVSSGNKLRPVPVKGGLEFQSLSAGAAYTCGITTDRLAYCWGVNNSGELGDGTKTLRLAPVPVAGGRKWRTLSAGYRHTCGVTMGDVAFCWGFNGDGAIGDGTTTTRTKPAKIAGGVTFVQVRAGGNHSCGWNGVGKVYCWGANDEGQLGDGTRERKLSPIAVPYVPASAQVSPGGAHTCAATLDHYAWCWGRNNHGQIGDGSTTRWLSPNPASNDGHKMDATAAGNFHTCALDRDNRAYCWGANDEGQLGDGTNTQRLFGVAVKTTLRFDRINVGAVASHTCAITAAGVAYCWGKNNSGELGDGTSTDRNVPVKVKSPA
jgi:alpha-tubulin suppressor-like RCC1 family protein